MNNRRKIDREYPLLNDSEYLQIGLDNRIDYSELLERVQSFNSMKRRKVKEKREFNRYSALQKEEI